MEISSKLSLSPRRQPTSVALGLFDGVHRGHRAVIEAACGCSQPLVPAVFTFRFDDPEKITKRQFGRLLSQRLKLQKLEELGVQFVFEPSFTDIMEMEPERFITEILFRYMNAEEVFCGEDFTFGSRAAGDVSLLKRACEASGKRLTVIPPVLDKGAPVSSTRIRAALREGDVDTANRLLGYPFMTDGVVVHGRHMGASLGFPTINQIFRPEELIPRFGVYATTLIIDGKRYIGATDVGVKPTVGKENLPAAETYILDFSGNLYGRDITLSYHAFLRGEKKFSSLEELTRTVLENADEAKRLLS